jgi:hypothetical protein
MSPLSSFISKIAAVFRANKDAGVDEAAESAESQERGEALERVIHAELQEHHAADAAELKE